MKAEESRPAIPPPGSEGVLPAIANWARNPIYVQSEKAFLRDLPQLLKRHDRKWAAYHGDECLGIARTQTELWQRCLRRGLKPGEFTVRFIYEGRLYDTEELGWMTIDIPTVRHDCEE